MPEAGEVIGCAGSSEVVLAVLEEAEADDMGCLFKTKRVSAKTPAARLKTPETSASIIGKNAGQAFFAVFGLAGV